MDVQTEVFLESHARVEVLSGATGRRRWPDEVKGRLVAESFRPGVSVREVAERNGLRANRLPKAGGGRRPLGIPTVADRIAQEVVRRYAFHHRSKFDVYVSLSSLSVHLI